MKSLTKRSIWNTNVMPKERFCSITDNQPYKIKEPILLPPFENYTNLVNKKKEHYKNLPF